RLLVGGIAAATATILGAGYFYMQAPRSSGGQPQALPGAAHSEELLKARVQSDAVTRTEEAHALLEEASSVQRPSVDELLEDREVKVLPPNRELRELERRREAVVRSLEREASRRGIDDVKEEAALIRPLQIAATDAPEAIE